MQSIDERFMDKFKALEKICNDMFDCQSGVTEYINQLKARSDCIMENGRWHDFYVQLRDCRDARNALVHPDDYVYIGETDIEFLDKLYQDILNRRDPLCKLPELHKVSFCVDEKLVATVNFKEGDRRIIEPAVPKKEGYVGKWSSYTLGNKDIFIDANYTPIMHKASFYTGNKLIATVNFKEGDRRIIEPAVPQIAGYEGRWEDYTLGNKDIVINAIYAEKKEVIPNKDVSKSISFSDAQTERNKFWKCFDKYLAQQGSPFYVTHDKGGKNQAAGNINTPNPMAMQTVCCEYKYRNKEVVVLVYINHKMDMFEYLYSQKTKIENHLGYKVEWIEKGPHSNFVQKIQKVFPINNKSYDEIVKEVFPYILGFVQVFEPYIKLFAD